MPPEPVGLRGAGRPTSVRLWSPSVVRRVIDRVVGRTVTSSFRRGVLGLMLVVAACSGGAALQLDSGAIGSEVTITVGETMEIALPGNPTTGFSWEVSSIDSAVLTAVGDPSFRADSTLVGSGGTMTLQFEAVAPGTTALELVYHRPFEDVPPEDAFSLTVVVVP